MTTRSSNVAGALLALAAFASFAVYDISVKYLGGGYNPLQIMFLAGLMTFPLVSVYTMADRTADTLRPKRPGWMALRSIVILLNGVFGTFAFATLPLAQCYAIFFTMPVLIALLAVPMLGEKIDLPRGIAVVAGLIGVLIALDPGRAPLMPGHLAAFAGAALGAVNYIIIRKTGGVERTAVMMLYPMVFQFAAVAIAMPWVFVPVPFRDVAITGLMAVAGMAGSLLIIAAYRRAPAIIVAPMQYSQIIWGAITGTVMFGESLTVSLGLGTALIILSGIFLVSRQDKPS